MKIDIEGGEYHAFLGMQEMIYNRVVKTIVFELNKTMLQQDYKLLHEFLYQLQQIIKSTAFYNINNDGDLIETTLDTLFAQGSCEHVVVLM